MRRGLSLVELVVAVAIILISVLALTYLLAYTLKYSELNSQRQEALYKAESVLNHLTTLDFSNSCLSPGTHPCETDTSGCCGDYSGDSSVVYEVVDVNSDLKDISVVVTYGESTGERGSVKIERLKGNW